MKCSTVLVSLAAVFSLLLGMAGSAAAEKAAGKYWVFLGTSGHGSKGIYRFELDTATGKAGEAELAGEASNPGFLAIHPSGKYLYAVGDISEPGGRRAGGVLAFAFDPATGKLTRLNGQPSGGSGPCHIVLDSTGKTALVANYGSGSAASFPIEPDGKVGPAASVRQHKGSSVVKGRQEGPHAHSINLDPANRFAVVADLGLDQVLVYRFDRERNTLTPNEPPYASVTPGAGPRHFAFHPRRPFAYVINEIGNTVTVFDYDADRGELTKKQEISTLPADFKGTSYTAEVVIHPSGKFLYGSNRGHDSIAVFSINGKTGELTALGHQATDIKTPRNFAVDPTGKWLLVGNQDSHSVVIFRVQKDGTLEPTGQKVDVPAPICVRFLKK